MFVCFFVLRNTTIEQGERFQTWNRVDGDVTVGNFYSVSGKNNKWHT